MLARLIVVAAVVAEASGFAYLAGNIPNGLFVPNPCGKDMWPGVGHMAKTGGGERNAFGKAFKAANFVWADVCRLDSDGDGMSNGEELGDPNCVWSIGTAPTSTTGLSHPGFCDPLEDAKCMNNPNKPHCESQVFDCPAINDQEVRRKDLRFPKTKVPNKETNYYCMTFDLDQDQDYHLIATKPEIDNTNVMHHMLLYGCTDEAGNISSPSSCGMSSEHCQEVIGLWSVGVSGECLYKDAGFRIGKTGFKRVLLEMHWNNPEERSDYVDGSAMTIFYTSKLRMHDAGVFWTGETNLVIPPRRERVVFDSECPADCTRSMLNGTIYFTQGFNHMHYRGILQRVRQSTGGVVTDLTNEPDFNYDTPKKYVYDPPRPVNPGDTLYTTCIFQSLKDDKTVYFGEGTDDEMCFGFFTYFPKANARKTNCVSSGTYDICRSEDGQYGDCNLNTFFNRNHTDTRRVMDPVINNCHGTCTEECRDAIERTESHPCLTKENQEWAIRFTAFGKDDVAKKFVAGMDDCDWDWPTTAAAGQTAVSSFIAAAVTAVYLFL